MSVPEGSPPSSPPSIPPGGRSAPAAAVAELRGDLLADGGPRISTTGTYRFAILVYDPRREFELRREIRKLTDELADLDWNVHAVSLYKLFLDRLRREVGPELVERWIATEKRLRSRAPERGLEFLKDKLARLVEGPDGIAGDVERWIDGVVAEHDVDADRTVILLGRTGALHPFFRSSALLKHLDGKTRSLPVVLLYPGLRRDLTRLSFMGELPADGDYRPRIYGGRAAIYGGNAAQT